MRYVSRRFSSSGKVLSEEEKAAENVYIKVNKYCCLFGILGFFFLIDLLDVAAGLQFTYAFSFDFQLHIFMKVLYPFWHFLIVFYFRHSYLSCQTVCICFLFCVQNCIHTQKGSYMCIIVYYRLWYLKQMISRKCQNSECLCFLQEL